MFLFQEPDYLRYQSLYVMTLDDILNNNMALQAFIGNPLLFILFYFLHTWQGRGCMNNFVLSSGVLGDGVGETGGHTHTHKHMQSENRF